MIALLIVLVLAFVVVLWRTIAHYRASLAAAQKKSADEITALRNDSDAALKQAHKDLGDAKIDAIQARKMAEMAQPTYDAANTAYLSLRALDRNYTNLIGNLKQRIYTQKKQLEQFSARLPDSERARIQTMLDEPIPTLDLAPLTEQERTDGVH